MSLYEIRNKVFRHPVYRGGSLASALTSVVQRPIDHRDKPQWRGLKRKLGRNAGDLKLG